MASRQRTRLITGIKALAAAIVAVLDWRKMHKPVWVVGPVTELPPPAFEDFYRLIAPGTRFRNADLRRRV